MDTKEDTFHLGVKALLFNQQGKLLLLQLDPKKYKNTPDICWDIPGGRIQKNESLEEALKREVYEETGLRHLTKITPFTMSLTNIRISVPNGDVGLIYAIYLCEVEVDVSIQLSQEHVHFGWFEPSKSAELLTNYPRELSEKIAKLSSLAGLSA